MYEGEHLLLTCSSICSSQSTDRNFSHRDLYNVSVRCFKLHCFLVH